MNSSGELIWIRQFSDSTSVFGLSMSVDLVGNVYVAGLFFGDFDMNPNEGIDLATSGGFGNNAFVVKLDTDGNYVWGRAFEGEYPISILDMAVDPVEGITAVGSFVESVDFDPGPETYFQEVIDSMDPFILKLSSEGEFEWVKTYGESNIESAQYICIDDEGQMYVAGTHFAGIDLDPGPGENWVESNGYDDVFKQKFDAEAQLIWAFSYGSEEFESVSELLLDSEGNIYISGDFNQTVDFDPGPGEQYFSSEGFNDAYILKLNNDGEFMWCKTYGDELGDKATDLALDSMAHVYSTIRFNGEIAFGGTNENFIFNTTDDWKTAIVRWNTDGEFSWAGFLDGDGNSTHYALEIDKQGYLISGGAFRKTVNLSFLDNQEIYNPEEWISDAFLVKYDKSCMINTNVGVYDDYLMSEQNNAEYQWFSCNDNLDPIDGATQQTYYPQLNTGNWVEITVDNCVDSSECFVAVNVDELNAISNVNLFPNPNSGQFTLELPTISENSEVSIMDNTGRIVLSEKLQSGSNQIYCDHLPAVMYVARICFDDGSEIMRRMVIE